MYNTTHRRTAKRIWSYNSWDSKIGSRNTNAPGMRMGNVILGCGFLTW